MVLHLMFLSVVHVLHKCLTKQGRQELEVNASSEILTNTATAEDFVEVKERGIYILTFLYNHSNL